MLANTTIINVGHSRIACCESENIRMWQKSTHMYIIYIYIYNYIYTHLFSLSQSKYHSAALDPSYCGRVGKEPGYCFKIWLQGSHGASGRSEKPAAFMLWQAANKQRQAVTYYSLMFEFEYMLAFHCEACAACQDHWQKTARKKHQETVRRKLATSRVTQGNQVESCGSKLRGQLQYQPTDSGRRALCEAFTTCFCQRRH